jgi:hypothetical protein
LDLNRKEFTESNGSIFFLFFPEIRAVNGGTAITAFQFAVDYLEGVPAPRAFHFFFFPACSWSHFQIHFFFLK